MVIVLIAKLNFSILMLAKGILKHENKLNLAIINMLYILVLEIYVFRNIKYVYGICVLRIYVFV